MAAVLAADRDTRVADAAMQDNQREVVNLLKHKADVNAPQGDGATALHWAAYQNNVDLAQKLIHAGASVKAVTRLGAISPLLMACRNGSASMIDVLLAAGADANSPDEHGTTALMMAAASGNADAVRTLLNHRANVNARESVHGQTALMFAAALNRGAVVQVLMAHGADAALQTKVAKLERIRFDEAGNVIDPKKEAAEKAKAAPKDVAGGKDATVGVGAGAGAKPKDAAETKKPKREFATEMGGMTPLLFAARDGQRDAVSALVECGVNVNEVSGAEHISPLVMAIFNGHYDVAAYLLDHGADPNITTIQGLAPLYATVDVQWVPHGWSPWPITDQEKTTYLQLMKALLDHGANPNAKLLKKVWSRSLSQDGTWVDAAGATAFWRAAQATDVAAMQLLVSGGADPNVPTKAGVTPLMVASGLGWAANFSVNAPGSWMPAVKYCLDQGANPNAVDETGYTALHGSAFIGNNEMISFLVSKGAKANAKTKSGDTIADMANGPVAHSIPHPETVSLLESLGSVNSHNCRSDQCVVAPKEEKKAAVGAAAKP